MHAADHLLSVIERMSADVIIVGESLPVESILKLIVQIICSRQGTSGTLSSRYSPCHLFSTQTLPRTSSLPSLISQEV